MEPQAAAVLSDEGELPQDRSVVWGQAVVCLKLTAHEASWITGLLLFRLICKEDSDPDQKSQIPSSPFHLIFNSRV